jgi:hypothetical protein
LPASILARIFLEGVAMQIGQPQFLPLLALATLPILIHLLARRRRQVVPFAMTRFLQEANLQAQGRRWLRELLLLALRTGAVLFAMLSLLRLYAVVPLPLPPAPTAIALVVDNSLSLHARQGTQTWWQRALRWCQGFIATTPADIALIAADRSAQPLCNFTGDKQRLRQALAGLRLTFRALDLTPALQTADALLATQPAAVKRLVVITDTQSEPFRSLRLPPLRHPLTVVDVRSNPDAGNARLEAQLRLPLDPKVDGQLWAQLRNVSRRTLTGRLIVRFGNRKVAEQTVRLGDGKEARFAFPVSWLALTSADRQGLVRGEVLWQSPDDVLPTDNRIAFLFRAPDRLRVAVVLRQGANFAVAALRALNLTPLNGWRWDADTLLVSAPSDATFARQLLAWVRKGHNAIVVADAPNSPLWATLGVTVRLNATPMRRVRWTDETTPLLQGLGSVLQIVATRPITVQGNDSRLRILATLDDGSPLLLELPVGFGRFLLLTAPLNERESNLVHSPAFVPLLYRLVTYAAYDGGQIVPKETEQPPTATLLRSTLPPRSESDFLFPSRTRLRDVLRQHQGDLLTADRPPQDALALTPLRDLSPLCLALAIFCLLLEGILTALWWRRR